MASLESAFSVEVLRVDQFQSPVPADLKCGLCGHVPVHPVLAPCEHTCCPKCAGVADPAGRHRSGPGAAACPVCQAPVPAGEWRPTGRLVSSILGQLEVLCDHKASGCPAVFPLLQRNKHLQECPKAPTPCPNGCGVSALREALGAHTEHCDHRDVNCQFCGVSIKVYEMGDHETVCPFFPVTCTCGFQAPRRDHTEHQRGQQCPHQRRTPCPLAPLCQWTGIAGDLAQHLLQDLPTHLHFLHSNPAVKELQQTVQALRAELQQTKLVNDMLQKQLQEVSAVVQQTKDTCQPSWYGIGYWRGEGMRSVWSLGNMNQRIKTALLTTEQSHTYVPCIHWSPLWSTSLNGYRFSLRLDLGNLVAKRTVGLYIHLHEGPYDDSLQWPFPLDYTVQVGNVGCTISQRESAQHYKAVGRPPHTLSWGWANFCPREAFELAILEDSLEITIVFFMGGYSGLPTAGPVGIGGPANGGYKN